MRRSYLPSHTANTRVQLQATPCPQPLQPRQRPEDRLHFRASQMHSSIFPQGRRLGSPLQFRRSPSYLTRATTRRMQQTEEEARLQRQEPTFQNQRKIRPERPHAPRPVCRRRSLARVAFECLTSAATRCWASTHSTPSTPICRTTPVMRYRNHPEFIAMDVVDDAVRKPAQWKPAA